MKLLSKLKDGLFNNIQCNSLIVNNKGNIQTLGDMSCSNLGADNVDCASFFCSEGYNGTIICGKTKLTIKNGLIVKVQ